MNKQSLSLTDIIESIEIHTGKINSFENSQTHQDQFYYPYEPHPDASKNKLNILVELRINHNNKKSSLYINKKLISRLPNNIHLINQEACLELIKSINLSQEPDNVITVSHP